MRILHLALQSAWESSLASGSYQQSTLERTLAEEGFIHASTPDQVVGVATRFYADVTEPLVLLALDDDAVRAAGTEVRYEAASDQSEGLFPHIYGPIAASWVHEVRAARFDASGRFGIGDRLPALERTRTSPVRNDAELGTDLGFLRFLREAIELKASGLTEEQARRRLVPSATTAAGILQHLITAERYWVGELWAGQGIAEAPTPANDADAPDDEAGGPFRTDGVDGTEVFPGHDEPDESSAAATWQVGPEDTIAALLGRYRAVCAHTDAILTEANPGAVVTRANVPGHPTGAPTEISLRWVLQRLITETARHAGHLDIIRELIDGRVGE